MQIGQARNEPLCGKCGYAGQAQVVATLMATHEFPGVMLQGVQQAVHFMCVITTRRRQQYTMPPAGKQGQPQIIFQGLYLA